MLEEPKDGRLSLAFARALVEGAVASMRRGEYVDPEYLQKAVPHIQRARVARTWNGKVNPLAKWFRKHWLMYLFFEQAMIHSARTEGLARVGPATETVRRDFRSTKKRKPKWPDFASSWASRLFQHRYPEYAAIVPSNDDAQPDYPESGKVTDLPDWMLHPHPTLEIE
jgi:hypothetical protein